MEAPLVYMIVMTVLAAVAAGVAIWSLVAQKYHAAQEVHRELDVLQAPWTVEVVRPATGQALTGTVTQGQTTYQFFRLTPALHWVQFHWVLSVGVNPHDPAPGEALVLALPDWAAPVVQASGTVDAQAAGVTQVSVRASDATAPEWFTVYAASSKALPAVTRPCARLEGPRTRGTLAGVTLRGSGAWLCTGAPSVLTVTPYG